MGWYPGGYFTIRQWLPVSWNRTIYRYRWFTSGDISDNDVRALMIKHKETTGAEDEVVVCKIQKAMQSRAFEPGPYVIGDRRGAMSEVGLRHFHNLYREALGE
ncbi:MAG: phenylpropionate dioxygenase-like ring-hydroxylating dioxygenase large terminal subunit [Parasphingorhabdus sp.]|jgi:phenylpropionate dioxygenase-like ring-hydroxylating dioxygenase large terminal subunit